MTPNHDGPSGAVAAASDDMSELRRVTAVVVTFNSAHCLPGLSRSLSAFPNVLIVDNASQDSTLSAASQMLPSARILVNPGNLGFGAANNRAVAQASTEFILLVNPDCLFDASAVIRLVETADNFPEAAMVAPQIVDRSGRLEGNYRWCSDQWSSKGPLAEGPACVGFVTGAFMLIRRQAWVKVGGFDERYFLYYEDEDLCMRLGRQCGAIILEPRAIAQHLSRGSVGGRARFKSEYIRGYFHVQSKLKFSQDYLHRPVTLTLRMRLVLATALIIVLRALLLDGKRSARSLGRMVGVFAYRG